MTGNGPADGETSGLDAAITKAQQESEADSGWTDEDVAAATSTEAAGGPAEGDDNELAALLAHLESGRAEAEDEAASSRPAWRADEITEEVGAGGPPAWLGTRWRDLPPEDQAGALVDLREWVDWLVGEFSIERSVLPACWFCHPAIIAELHAAMNMEYKVWEEGAPTLTPMLYWLPHLSSMVSRLRVIMGNLPDCALGNHVQQPTTKLSYDEVLWAAAVDERSARERVERPATGQALQHVRAVLVDDEGTEVAVSNVGGVRPVTEAVSPEISIKGTVIYGSHDAALQAQFSGAGELRWQTAPESSGPWRDLGSSEPADEGDE